MAVSMNSINDLQTLPNYNSSENFNKMEWSELPIEAPKGISPDRIVELSKEAEKDVVSKTKKIAIYILSGVFAAVFLIPAFLLTTVKWIFWNPIELICRVTSRQEPL